MPVYSIAVLVPTVVTRLEQNWHPRTGTWWSMCTLIRWCVINWYQFHVWILVLFYESPLVEVAGSVYSINDSVLSAKGLCRLLLAGVRGQTLIMILYTNRETASWLGNWLTSRILQPRLLTLPRLPLFLWKNFFCVRLSSSGPPAMARMIASAIRSLCKHTPTAASKLAINRAWATRPSQSVEKIHFTVETHRMITFEQGPPQFDNNFTTVPSKYWTMSYEITSKLQLPQYSEFWRSLAIQ